MNKRSIYWFLFLMLIVSVDAAPQVHSIPYSIHDFSGGLNTVDNVRKIQKNQADDFYNWTLDETGGSLAPRPGYHAVTDSLAGYNKIWGIHSHKFSTGQAVLSQVLDRDDTCWADVYISNTYSYGADDSIGSYLYPKELIWLSWLDNMYLFNGKNIPKVIVDAPDDAKMLDMIPKSPSEFDIIPLCTDGAPYGEFIYAIVYKPEADSSLPWATSDVVAAYLVEPIFMDSNVVMVNNLPHFGPGLWNDPTYDSIIIALVKTRPNHINFSVDSVFMVDSVTFIDGNDDIDNIVFYDNDPGNFTSGDYVLPLSKLQIHYIWWNYTKIGSMDSICADTGSINHNRWISDGSGDESYVSYVCCFLDTVTMSYSDTNLQVRIHTTDTLFNITLWIPPVPDDRYVRVIFRDLVNYLDNLSTGFYCVDTVLNPNDTIFYDTLQQDTIMIYNEPLDIQNVRKRFSGAITHEGRMFAWDDHYIYMSQTATAGQWKTWDVIEFDLDDGDRIIYLASHEGYIIVYKTNSIYILYTTDGYVTQRSKRSYGVGMIAPQSLANYNGANLFLSKTGIQFETANIYKDRSLEREAFSKSINNVLLRDLDSMVSAVGKILHNIYLLSYPGKDTTFALFFESNGFSVWSFDFLDAVDYDTLKRSKYTTFSDVIFIKNDDERIFLLDQADTTDNGTDFICRWAKTFWAPMVDMLAPQSIHLWKTATVSANDSIDFVVTNEQQDTLVEFSIDSLNYVYDYRSLSATDNKLGHYLTVQFESPARSNLKIDGLDVFLTPAGPDIQRR